MKSCSLEQARAAKGAAAKIFGRRLRVAGVGITSIGDGYGLKVNLVEAAAGSMTLPTEVEGVPVTVEVVGPISKRRP
jgi:hypothetical protein